MALEPQAVGVVVGKRSQTVMPTGYYSGVRSDFVCQMPDDANAVILEIGCGEGGTGALALVRGKCARYVGIEIHAPAAQIASTRLSRVLVGDVERMDLEFDPESFDVLVLSEVLEHLVDPWSVLARISECIKPGGLVFASVPNISHHRVISELIKGRWELQDCGVLDRRHLRWFTPATFRRAFEQSGFVVQRVGPSAPLSRKAAFVNRLTCRRFEHLLFPQMSLKAHKAI